MDYTPHRYKNQNGMQLSFKHLNKRSLWFNSDFNSDFSIVDGLGGVKIYDMTFDVNPFEIYKFNRLKVFTYIRDTHQSRPIQIKLKTPLSQSRDVINSDKESYPIIYNNHTGARGMSYNDQYSLTLTPQQIRSFTFRLDDNISQFDYNSYFTSITNGSVFQIPFNPDEKYIVFNSSGSFVLDKNLICDILLIGGGGGGGGTQQWSRGAGGGGAGEYKLLSNIKLNSGSYSVTVGSAGAGGSGANNGSNGGNSSIVISGVTYTALGGGGGARGQSGSTVQGLSGASGGGSTYQATIGGQATNEGVTGYDGGAENPSIAWTAGGGGGFSSVGLSPANKRGGAGGSGVIMTITGANIQVCGGGGGGGYTEAGSDVGGGAGSFGGGNGGGYPTFITNIAYDGENATSFGSGGGGSSIGNNGSGDKNGGSGGSGVVIIKFRETRIEGITPEETLIQATNSSIPININSKYQINYQPPVNITKGTYETIFSNGAITFKSKPDFNYPSTSNNPIIWYKFDDSQFLYDSSGNNHLINSGATLDNNNYVRGSGSLSVTQNKVAKIGGADINLYSIQTTKGLSFSVWFRATYASPYGRVFEFVNDAPPELYSVIMDFPNSPGTNNLRIYTYDNGSYVNYTTSGTNFCDGSWRHIVWSISSTGVWSFYINGVNQNINVTANIPNSLDFNYNRVLGGSFTGGTGGAVSYMTGNIDDFRIFDYVLSPIDIYDLYNGNTDRSYPILRDANNATIDPLVWYKFDGSTNSLINDSSGNGYTLTNTGVVISKNNYIKGDGSASFVGLATNYFDMPTTIDFNAINMATGISFTCWIKINPATQAYCAVFQFGTTANSGANDSRFVGFNRFTGNNLRFFNVTTTVDGTLLGQGGNAAVLSDVNYADGTWRHITWTFSTSGYVNIYVNGVNKFAGQWTVIQAFTVNKVNRIGNLIVNGNNTIDGNIDDFRIYAKVLTATEISELYNGRVSIYNPPGFIIGLDLEDHKLKLTNTISTNNRNDS